MPLDPSPEPIRLRMPDECKRFVVPKWTTHTLIALPAAALALLVFIAEGLKALTITITHVLPIPLGFASWLWAVRSPWYYRINKNGMVNLLITSSGSSWHGTQLQWKNRIILSIGEATWQEYPALLMRVASKIDSTITDYSDMYLVYLPQDKYTIQDRVIPAIEYYREKYGHGEWIKAHGWESYAEPARQLADA